MNKRILGRLAAAAAFASFIAAAPAAAAGYYVYPTLTNSDASQTITVSDVTWSGSYNPQIAASLAAGASSPGRLKTVFDYGYSSLDFNANITDATGTVTCRFSLSVNNSTNEIASAQAVRWTGLPVCNVMVNGSSIYFGMRRDL